VSDAGSARGDSDAVPAECVAFASKYCDCVQNTAATCITQIEDECSTGFGWEPIVNCEVAAQTCDEIYNCSDADGG
jgi:hypothetical protein